MTNIHIYVCGYAQSNRCCGHMHSKTLHYIMIMTAYMYGLVDLMHILHVSDSDIDFFLIIISAVILIMNVLSLSIDLS